MNLIIEHAAVTNERLYNSEGGDPLVVIVVDADTDTLHHVALTEEDAVAWLNEHKPAAE